MRIDLLGIYLQQFISTLFAHNEAIKYIRKHRLWEGLLQYGWLSKFLMAIGILLGFKFIKTFMDSITSMGLTETANPLVEMGNMIGHVAVDSYDFLFHGSIKYLMLILLEVVIFHICRRCIELLTKTKGDLSLKTFIAAQIRMIKVVFRTYIIEMILTLGIKIFFGIFGTFDFFEPIVIFGLQCYFLGFLVMDNYLEQYGLSIKESLRYANQFIGVAVGAGLVLNLLLLIPFFGAIVAPIIAGVTVCLVMHSSSDLHLTPSKDAKVEPIPNS
ncbi:MAG: EI24 domain-containing protein [Saprospiraceae bacterium]